MKQRLAYIDALKGVGILMVIYQHLIYMGMRDIEYTSPVNNVFKMFFMSIFFFVSGFLCFKPQQASQALKTIVKKARQLLIPTIIFFVFCIRFFHLSFREYLFDPWKCGYWFTLTLFEVFCLHLLLEKLTRKSEQWQLIVFLIVGLLGYYISLSIGEEDKMLGIFSLKFLCKYYIFFAQGYCIAKYRERSFAVASNRYVSAGLLLVSVIPFFLRKTMPQVDFIFIMCQVFTIFFLFRSSQQFFASNNLIAKTLGLLGRHSLEIYLIHFFLLFRIDAIAEYLLGLQNDLCFRGASSRVVPELFILGTIALGIALTCIGIRKIFGISPLLSELCFGQLQPKNNESTTSTKQ